MAAFLCVLQKLLVSHGLRAAGDRVQLDLWLLWSFVSIGKRVRRSRVALLCSC